MKPVWDVAGVDEAGRGALAGPVVAAACILRQDVAILGIDDSKKLTPKERMHLYKELISHPGVVYGVGIVEAIVIDQINILQATFQAMVCAVQQLDPQPPKVLVDGNRAPCFGIPTECIISGDSSVLPIAAASIIAKCTRDLIMQEHHHTWPDYAFETHKGYGTKRHLDSLHVHGPCPIHRHSFAPIRTSV